ILIVPPGIGSIWSLTTELGRVCVNGCSFAPAAGAGGAAGGCAAAGNMSAEMSAPTAGMALLALCLTVTSSVVAPGDAPKGFTFTEYHMGVDARLVVYTANQPAAERACAAAFERIAALD